MRWGITLPLDGVPLSAHREAVPELESLGYTDAWTAEVDGADAFVPAAAALCWGKEMRVGTAIANVYTRGPAVLAQTAMAMSELAPGRFCLGLGVSTQVIVERWNGRRMERPLAYMRETVSFLRRVMAGERGHSELLGVQGFRLSRRLAPPPPIFVAALRQGMLRLAGQVADGVIINWLAPQDVPRVVAVAKEGARQAGRDPEALEVVCRIFVLPPLPDQVLRLVGRRMAVVYLTSPVYAAFHRWLGRGDLIRPMLEAWQAGDRQAAAELVPDSLLEELLVFGSRQECMDKLESYCRNGVTVPVLQPIVPAESPDQRAEMTFRLLRELVRP
ncbi:MAG TPA: LLM class F420-dependent oxidoreductase [Dehalococcoidia bacterium]|nr:LLM class F420-dependent oxidoreductase [Dehalococcoidia bacterium]